LDLALHLNGPVQDLSAIGSTENGENGARLICFASAQLTHKNGTFSRILASRVTDRKIRRIEATCGNAFAECELFRKELQLHKQSRIEHAADKYAITAVSEQVEVRQQEALLNELQAFVAFAKGGKAEVPTYADGIAAMSICESIKQAILK